jgi:hypothetical protein
MKADVSRSTFRPGKHYSGVVVQQGSVSLDADANEQGAIQRHLARSFAADVVGQHGGPGDGFKIEYVGRTEDQPADLRIHGGRYYIDGILADATRPAPLVPVPDADAVDTAAGDAAADPSADVVAEPVWTFWSQPWAYRDPEQKADELPAQFPFLVYLKVWDRLVTAIEDPEILEPALGAALPQTAARSAVTWQVLPLQTDLMESLDPAEAFAQWAARQTAVTSHLAARSKRPAHTEDDPCILPPDSRYRGPENQLYRVEVHRGGAAGTATVKWSRENGSVAFPIASVDGAWVTLGSLGRDDKLDAHVGDWVEVADDASTARALAVPLLRVEEIDRPARRVRLSGEPADGVGRLAARHPLLRRWDHRTPSGRGAPQLDEGAIRFEEGTWFELEDGVEVWFRPGGEYRTGDYWLIPARTLTGDVEWPRDGTGRALQKPPDGVRYHYAPLAWISGDGDVADLRRVFRPLTAL